MKSLNIKHLLIAMVLFLSACKLDKPILPGDKGYVAAVPPGDSTSTGTGTTGTGTTTTTGYYLTGTLGTTAINMIVDDSRKGWYEGSLSTLSSDTGEMTGRIEALITPGDTTKQQNVGVEFSTMQVNTSANVQAYFDGFVNTGAWNYATSYNFVPGVKTLEIFYADSKGKTYSSVGAQTGSTANISTVTVIAPHSGFNDGLKIKLSLNCVMYPTDGSAGSLPLKAEATVFLEDQLH